MKLIYNSNNIKKINDLHLAVISLSQQGTIPESGSRFSATLMRDPVHHPQQPASALVSQAPPFFRNDRAQPQAWNANRFDVKRLPLRRCR